MKRFIGSLSVLVLLVHLAVAQKPVQVSDLMKMVTINQLAVSPDGRQAAGVVNRKAVRNETEYYYQRHLYLLDLAGKESPRQLTFGDRNDGSPQWSPDGKHIAFTRTDNDKTQIWILPVAGGEAYALTRSEYGAVQPRWSPDGNSILYLSALPRSAIAGEIPWAYERPGRKPGDEPNFKALKPEERKKISASPDGDLSEVRAWLARNASESNPRVLNRLDLQGELSLQPEENFTHLFLQPFNRDEKAVQVTSGFQDFNSAEWDPSGKTIWCASRKYNVHPDVEEDADLWSIQLGSGSTFTATEFLHWEGYDLGAPVPSPDGSKILFRVRPTANRHAQPNQLAVTATLNGKPEILASALDRDISNASWAADGKAIYFTAESEGYIPVYRVSLITVKGKPSAWTAAALVFGEQAGINQLKVVGDRLLFTITRTENPWEAGLLNVQDKSVRMLTTFNESWLKERVITKPTVHRITRADGKSIQYWVMEPANRKPGVRYPVILNIHGGPSAMWGPGVFSMWHEFQVESAYGYGIVYCNPRGSGGYGDAFKKANYQEWGSGPASDILSSLDNALASNDWMDKDQLFVEGGSYAGYMVAWIIGHDNRFKAANAQRGVYDLTTFMGEGNAWRLVPTHFGGYPWTPGISKILDEQSPLTWVNRIQTPLLIIHGDQDLRTGVSQSEMLYKSLKIQGKPVEYIRYPKEGHELTRSGNPGRMMDHLLRVIEFFERYVRHPH